jgi:site-specific recombinase XerD
MNITYNLQIGKKSNQLMLRLYKNQFDVSCGIGISLEVGDWNQELQLANSPIINQKLSELKSNVLKAYNESFIQGTIIDKEFVKNIISDCFNRPTKEISQVNSDVFVYYSDFANNWLNTKADQWKISAKQTMPKYLKKQYEDFLELFLGYEKMLDSKLVLKDLSIDDFYNFANFLEDEGYNPSTIKRMLSRMKFFCARCSEEGIKVSSAFTQRVFVDDDSSEIEGVYLNEEEIDRIFNLDLDHDFVLDNIRDNFLISCWSGMRISDFLYNLKTDNIKDGFISIKTQKTKSFVKLPIHAHVKFVLDKRFGQLPKKMSATEYNKQLKIICQLAGIDNLVYGKVWNPTTKRKERKYLPKYAFCTSHIGRKSLCTNLAGKVPNELIQSVFGWAGMNMVNYYNQTTKTDYAEKLQEYWQNKN